MNSEIPDNSDLTPQQFAHLGAGNIAYLKTINFRDRTLAMKIAAE